VRLLASGTHRSNVARHSRNAGQVTLPVDLEVKETRVALARTDVRVELERIVKSRAMRRSPKLVRLLRFLVETTLNGDAQYLKETTVGVSVYGRSPDYDPKTDTIVRSQAWRLRAKLARYYGSEGCRDAVIIDIPKGQYSTTFSIRSTGIGDPGADSTSYRPHGSTK
jgi:hypothetical protein